MIEEGLPSVYVGNVPNHERNNTFCLFPVWGG